MNLTQAQALTMLELQSTMNCKVNPAWLEAGYPFLRAVLVEGVEGIEHHGWKWWKAQTLDMPQLRMELIDIWHFMLSDSIVKAKGNLNYTASAMVASAAKSHGAMASINFDGIEYRFNEMDIVRKLELIIGLAAVRRSSVPLFASLLIDCGMSWVDLYRQYVAKNILNLFRQDFGYKEGKYQKIWNGREDNEHLVELMNECGIDEPSYKDRLYAGLKLHYQSIIA